MNIRSIPKHFSDLKAYLANLNHSFSVIGISVTWLQDEVPSYPLVNYGLELDYRTHKREGAFRYTCMNLSSISLKRICL